MSKKPTPLQKLKEQMAAVDVLFEVRDARLPASSTHPKFEEMLGAKPRIVVFCKEDLADHQRLSKFIQDFTAEGLPGIALSLKMSKGKDRLIQMALNICKDKMAARRKKGLLDRAMRVAVIGLPNVGKSSLINWIAGQRKAKVANTPGVTRGVSWIRIHPQVDLLDTPGILPITAFKGEQSIKLALCNVLPSDHYDNEDVALWALNYLETNYASYLESYKTPSEIGDSKNSDLANSDSTNSDSTNSDSTSADSTDSDSTDPDSIHSESQNTYSMDADSSGERIERQTQEEYLREFDKTPEAQINLEKIAIARRCIKAGGVADLQRAAAIFLSDLRSGKLGRVVFDIKNTAARDSDNLHSES